MRLWKGRLLQFAFGTAIAILLVTGFLSYRSVMVTRDNNHWVDHTQSIIDGIQQILIAAGRVDMDGRSYILTGDVSYLKSELLNVGRIQSHFATVGELIKDNAPQHRRLSALEKSFEEKIALQREIQVTLQTSGVGAAAEQIRSGRGEAADVAFRVVSNQMLADETALLAARSIEAEQSVRSSEKIIAGGLVLALLITAVAGWSVRRDASRRRKAELASEVSNAKYRGLMEAAPDAMVVVNTAGEIVLLNVQAEVQFGYRRDELLAQKVTNIIPEGFAERLIADDLRSTEDAMAQQIGTGLELVGLRKDGSEFPIELMLSPLESPDGILVTAAIRNISVRKAADRHLVAMEGRYRCLLDAAPDAMVVVNNAGKIVLLNVQAERQFGYRRDELIGQKVTNIIPEGFEERRIADGFCASQEAMTQIGVEAELYGKRRDGSDFPIELMLGPLETLDGTLITAVIRDITRRKKVEMQLLKNVKELNRSNEELGQFAYIASHDLQEPLRMVASYTQLLQRRYTGKLDADADDFIAYAVDGATRMQRLIQDLLTFSRIETKGRALREISSEAAFDQAIVNLRGAIEESSAVITRGRLPFVMADDSQLVQLFQNLIGNAIKYQGAGKPVIHISAAMSDAERWNFSVRDNGLGIDPQYFEKIFGMFQRLHRREEFAGTGIGLAVCKKIVERHGGEISVESQPGEGSTFHFALAGAAGNGDHEGQPALMSA